MNKPKSFTHETTLILTLGANIDRIAQLFIINALLGVCVSVSAFWNKCSMSDHFHKTFVIVVFQQVLKFSLVSPDEGSSLAEHSDTKALPLPLVDPHLLGGVQTCQHSTPLP